MTSPSSGPDRREPAAALRALRERPGSRVVLLDAAAFPRDKCCGDGIAAEVFDLLAALGLRTSPTWHRRCRACACRTAGRSTGRAGGRAG